MKFKGTLAAVTALLTVGAFYTFALCVVEDVDENEISAEYYYSTETELTEPAELTAEETEKTEDIPKSEETAAPVTETETETAPEEAEDARGGDYGSVPETAAVTEVPVRNEEPPEPETVYAGAAEEENYFEAGELDEPEDGSAEASEQPVYGGYSPDSGEDTEAPPETEPPETEETAEETTVTYDGDIVINFFDGEDDPYFEGNAGAEVSVNVENSGDSSTSETFTAKINGRTQTVNAYELICQIVANEMSPSFSDEAIKAQAVAAYSYVKYHNVNGLTPSVLVKTNPSDKIKELVSEVWGVCCYYGGSVAQTVYMASSSGYTADAVNVWGGSVPYLKSVCCPFDADFDPNYGDTMKVSEDSMRDMLEGSLGITLSNNPYDWLVIRGYVDGNYVSELSVDGQKTISGRKLRESVMGHKLKSAAFDVYYSDGYFYFTTYGYGHGVGMSQNGANILAKQGYTYVDILKFYFTGIEVI